MKEFSSYHHPSLKDYLNKDGLQPFISIEVGFIVDFNEDIKKGIVEVLFQKTLEIDSEYHYKNLTLEYESQFENIDFGDGLLFYRERVSFNYSELIYDNISVGDLVIFDHLYSSPDLSFNNQISVKVKNVRLLKYSYHLLIDCYEHNFEKPELEHYKYSGRSPVVAIQLHSLGDAKKWLLNYTLPFHFDYYIKTRMSDRYTFDDKKFKFYQNIGKYVDNFSIENFAEHYYVKILEWGHNKPGDDDSAYIEVRNVFVDLENLFPNYEYDIYLKNISPKYHYEIYADKGFVPYSRMISEFKEKNPEVISKHEKTARSITIQNRVLLKANYDKNTHLKTLVDEYAGIFDLRYIEIRNEFYESTIKYLPKLREIGVQI